MMVKVSTTQQPNVWLWLALMATVALTVWTSIQPESENTDDDLVSPVTQPVQRLSEQAPSIAKTVSATPPIQSASPSSTWQARNRALLVGKPVDLFPAQDWVVAAPVIKTKPAPPPTPTPIAPPTPFTYMGKMEDGPKGTLIFLMANNKVYSVGIGENVDASWRLDGEDATRLMFTYMPLNLPQTLSKTQPLIAPELPNAAASALN